MLTLVGDRWICGLSRLLGPPMFLLRNCYLSVLHLLIDLWTSESEHHLVCIDGSVPMLRLDHFDEVASSHATLNDDLWLHGFVIRFLGELVLRYGRMTVAIEVAEIALAVVTHHSDLTVVFLVETYCSLDRALKCCRHFYGCGALVQVWLAAHMGLEVVHPQCFVFDTYCSTDYFGTIPGVPEMCGRLQHLIEGQVTWRILSPAEKSFAICFNNSDMQLIILPGFTGGVKYHLIRILHQFGLC